MVHCYESFSTQFKNFFLILPAAILYFFNISVLLIIIISRKKFVRLNCVMDYCIVLFFILLATILYFFHISVLINYCIVSENELAYYLLIFAKYERISFTNGGKKNFFFLNLNHRHIIFLREFEFLISALLLQPLTIFLPKICTCIIDSYRKYNFLSYLMAYEMLF